LTEIWEVSLRHKAEMNNLRIIGRAILEHHGFFSLDQIARETNILRRYVNDVLGVFLSQGIIKKIKKQKKEHRPGLAPAYSLTYRVANQKKLAERIAPRFNENTGQDRMWSVIRNKTKADGFFSLRDLIVLGGVVKNSARSYLKSLRKIGIIQPSRSGGGPGVEWRLLKDPGPRRPYVHSQKHRV
jgi:Fic family protein